MRRVYVALLGVAVFGVALGPSRALGQIYRWVDDQGRAHYSEGLDSVPSQFRAKAQALDLPKAPPPPPPAPEKREPEQKPPAGQPGEPPKEEGALAPG